MLGLALIVPSALLAHLSDVEPMVFATAFEGLTRAFQLDDPAVVRQLELLGVDTKKLDPAYPLATFLGALDVVVETLGSRGTPTTRHRLLGRAYVKGWVKTNAGLATLTVGKLLGPKRLLTRMQQTFRTSANYVVTSAQPVPPRSLELVVKADAPFVERLPVGCGRLIDYRHGLLEGLVEQFGVNDSVDIVERDDARAMARYLVKW